MKRTFGITIDPAGTELIYRQIAEQIAPRITAVGSGVECSTRSAASSYSSGEGM